MFFVELIESNTRSGFTKNKYSAMEDTFDHLPCSVVMQDERVYVDNYLPVEKS